MHVRRLGEGVTEVLRALRAESTKRLRHPTEPEAEEAPWQP
jgi:hypothetical protein